MNITGIYNSYFDKSGEQNEHINTSVAKSLSYFVHNYFLTYAPSFLLSISCRNNHTENFYNEMLIQLFAIWGTPILQIIKIRNGIFQYIDGIRNYNLILTCSFEAFADLNVSLYTTNYNINEYYFIFLQCRDVLIPGEMRKIFEYCWKNHLINCSIQIQNQYGEILVYTYFPYTPNNCYDITPILINQFNGTSMINEQIFPNKLRNFYGCPLRIATYNTPPYLYLEQRQNGEYEITSGFEGVLLKELAIYMNFTIDINVPRNDEMRGTFGPNGSINGAMGMLKNDKADIAIGCIRRTTERSAIATPTEIYYQTQLIITAYIPPLELTSVEIFSFPFQPNVWITLAIFIVIALGILYFMNKLTRHSIYFASYHHANHSYLNMISVAAGLSTIFIPRQAFGRLVNMTWLIATMILRSCYQAMMFLLIRLNVLSKLPRTLDEMVNNNFTFVMNKRGQTNIQDIKVFETIKYLVLNTTSENLIYQYLQDIDERNYLAVGAYDYLHYYVRITQQPNKFKIMADNIMNMPTTIYLQKHSFLVYELNEVLRWFRDMGLIRYWSTRELNPEYLSAIDTHYDNILGMNELYIIFAIITCCYCTSIVIFLLELLSIRFNILKKLF